MAVMVIPGAWITTLAAPQAYTDAQLDLVCRVAAAMAVALPHRGRFVLCEAPERDA